MSEPEDILQQLEPLRVVPARSDAAARSGLQTFLNEAAQLRAVPEHGVPGHAVSAPAQMRPTGWKSFFKPARSPMLLLAKIMLIVTLTVGGAGATTVAAQSSLPGDGLYPIKLFIEDVQWGSAQSPEAQIEVQLEHAQERVWEMAQLVDRGTAIPTEAPDRLQTQLQAALRTAAQLDDTALQTTMQQIEAQVMTQARSLAQAQANAPDDRGLRNAVQVLAQMQAMTQLGVSDPAAFRARFGSGRPSEQPTPNSPAASHTPAPAHTLAPSHTPQASRTLASSHTPLAIRTPQATRTPNSGTPQGNQYGPGAQATPNQGATTQPVATPIGSGDGHEYGPQPTTQSGNGEPQATPSGNGGPQATPSGNGGNPEQTPQPGGGSGGGGPH